MRIEVKSKFIKHNSLTNNLNQSGQYMAICEYMDLEIYTHHVKLKHLTIGNTEIIHSVSIMPIIIQGFLIISHPLIDVPFQFNLDML